MKRDSAAKLVGKVALVTGGSRGIGLAIAKALLESGASVVITGRKEAGLREAVGEFNAAGLTNVMPVVAHSAQLEQVRDAFQQASERFGTVQIVVNNAATNPTVAPLTETEPDVFDKVLSTNVSGYLNVAREGVRRLRDAGQGGSVINISSAAAFRSWEGLGAYGVSKAAVNMMTQILAAELGPEGIRVNGVAPGVVRTRFSEVLWKDPQRSSDYVNRVPLRRVAEVDDIVGAALYLASDASSYVTGQTLVVDGGLMA